MVFGIITPCLTWKCSNAKTAAPLYSPPVQNPCNKRHIKRVIGAIIPKTSYPGKQPITKLGIPISIIEIERAFFLPHLSPIYPKTIAPKGRVQKAAEKTKIPPNKKGESPEEGKNV